MKRGALLAMVALVLSGCGGGADPVEEPPPPPAVRTLDELAAALPALEEVDGAQALTVQCPGDATCADDERSVKFAVSYAGEPAEQEIAAARGWVTPFVWVEVLDQEPSEAVDTVLDDDGPFDQPPVPGDDGQPGTGEKGTRTSGEDTLDGWRLTWQSRTSVLYGVDGDESPELQTEQLQLRSGQMMVRIFVGLDSAGRDATAAHDQALALAQDYLDRLD